MAAVAICSDLGAQENKVCHCFHCFPIYLPWSDEIRCHDLSFLNVEFEASFFTLLYTFIKRFFSSSLLSAIIMVSSAYLRLLIFLCIKKQRHYLADKGLSSQSYGFSNSDVWMWELDHKESWALKNWCFQTVVLGKTLESPLDCMEIQPVNPKGKQS